MVSPEGSRSPKKVPRRSGGSSRAAPAVPPTRRFECRIASTDEEIAAHFAVRHEVFVEEQGLFSGSDRDEHDEHAILIVAVHLQREATGSAVAGAAVVGSPVVGAVRCYEADPGIWFGGRLAVLDAYRRRGGAIGSALCRRAEEAMIECGADHFLAYIQEQNVRFFQHLGWWRVGEPVTLFGTPHQVMEASMGRPRPRRAVRREDFPCLQNAEADARQPG